MEVNRELPSLEAGLDESVHLLKPEGRMVVLAYHSLEDRMVKERFADWSRTEEPGYVPTGLPAATRNPLTRLLTRRALRPSAPRSRRTRVPRAPACARSSASRHDHDRRARSPRAAPCRDDRARRRAQLRTRARRCRRATADAGRPTARRRASGASARGSRSSPCSRS